MSTLKRSRNDDGVASEPPPKRYKATNSNTTNTESPLNRRQLPIDECKDKILSIINHPENDIIIITGDTGSGKSTQLSQILYHSGLYESIIITQPRRIGAVSLARRVSQEMNTTLGETVGYTIRFQDYSSTNTHIRYVTDGILLRELTTHSNKHHIINKYDVIILDEAHERSLQTDILFSILRDIVKHQKKKKKKKAFKLLITSATLNVDKFSSFFMNAPVYHIPGRCFPVEILHCTQQQRDYINGCVDTALQIHCTETDVDTHGELGHILCFLTGQNEIDRACRLMGDKIDEMIANDSDDSISDCVILGAYGSMSYDKQQEIFAKVPQNCRKIIFATNIAETSLTVNGICYVIDPGLVKQKQFNYDQGIEELVINNISKISAIQRKGRCGRTRNGKCYRLYTKQELNEFDEETIPEILRNDLCWTILTLKTIGINDIRNFEYLDKPHLTAFVNALDKLYLLDAIDENGDLNGDIGRKMSKIPLDAIYSKILIESQRHKCMDIALSLVSIISANGATASDLFIRPSASLKDEEKRKYYESHKEFDSKYGDIISWLLVFNHFMRMSKETNDDMLYEWTRQHYVKYRILNNALKIRQQLEQIIEKECGNHVLLQQATKPIKAIRKVLAKSLFMQSAKMMDNTHKSNSRKYKHNDDNKNKRNVMFRIYNSTECDLNAYIHPSSISSLMSTSSLDFKWAIYLEIVYTSKPFMRGICGIKYEWISTLLPKMAHRVQWFQQLQDEKQEKNDNVVAACNNHNDATKHNKESNMNVIHKNVQKQSNIDSVKERYLKRKMLKNKLKTL